MGTNFIYSINVLAIQSLISLYFSSHTTEQDTSSFPCDKLRILYFHTVVLYSAFTDKINLPTL
jgi:hypothetical protein